MSATRRSVLRGMALSGLAVGGSGLLAACGDDGGGASSGSGATVKFGINEAQGSGPAYDRLKAIADAYTAKTDTKVSLNAVDHNTFQESINTYLQGTPDDVFTWFAGFRMSQFAESGLITDVSDQWPIDGLGDSFKQAATASDGKQYFVPISYYPWAVFYRKSVFEKNGWAAPESKDDFMSLMDDMQGKGITPFAFGDKDGWPAMGTFDILNMRLNGFDFHMGLMAGEEKWDGDEVKLVFETWKSLLPYHQEDPLGRTWQEAATSMGNGDCGMYLLGTFVVDALDESGDDLDFFTFPQLDDSIPADSLDAPIDGFCVAAAGKNQDAAKEMIKWLGSAAAADAGNEAAEAPFIAANSGASTSTYSDLQKKSAEVVGAAANIAQFMDRDTNADFASTVMIPSIQEFLKSPDDIDKITASIQEQANSILG
ncbi:ABC transporter substrate-binding protein [Nocardioides currus]|uniref:Probable sugar-binding periplasmic protein n=1 Tax=Nocardioides currus TaxID=2133958 RepID=A0A2R7YWD5_9ACTN|nr:ABC transporter substrate-binding protein [Nocardioides currus]PUA80199.1 sugar ABC transporter substrate-binding protein [Nocardioides currus]